MEAGMKRIIAAILMLLVTPALFAAGTLTSVASGNAPMQIKEHLVNVVIDNGFARTEVIQTFFNPND
jgi:Ca-activated chloride channel family protein